MPKEEASVQVMGRFDPFLINCGSRFKIICAGLASVLHDILVSYLRFRE